MKTTILIIKSKLYLLLLLPLILIGCDEMLQEEPKTFLNESSVFESEEGAVSATLGVYEVLRHHWYYGQGFYSATILHSDYARGRGSYVPMGNYQLDATNINRLGNIWSEIYSSINRANIVIQEVPKVDEVNTDLSNQLVAEARFLRALGYYNLVRLWGDVPLRLEPESEEFDIERSSSGDVYAQIIEDLKFGENNLPNSYPDTENGRVTKWAAKTLLADLYLTLNRWSESASKAQEVMDSDQFSLVQVSTSEDFHTKIFGPSILTHSEDILSIKYSVELNNDSYVRFFHKAGPQYAEGGPHVFIGNLASFIGEGEWATEQSPDLRRNHTMYSGKDTVYLDENVPMLFSKFRGTPSNVSNNTPLLRYPEVLLIFAEAKSQANGGPDSAAYEAINKVRRRAYGTDPGIPNNEADLPENFDAEDFRDAILLEKAKEFLGEGKRWFDLLRTDKAIEIIQSAGFTNIAERNLKWPIPPEEIDNNQALTPDDQNPGW